MLTVIVDKDEQHLSILKSDFEDKYLDNGDELLFREYDTAYLEYQDNSDDYDEDEEGYEEWVRLELPYSSCSNVKIVSDSDLSVIDFLKRFKDVEIIVNDTEKGVAKLCTSN